ncbi:hypothetical protein [Phytomonospora endophytica]|uniref:Uncharacterized protein n=1 Tax=Phytomonospora endophytica TaxID=714109 RepID=A0A841FFU2_9ACTN|nr:hypothetical protein [Phytomonospora endophytica]MBB6032708.1 hypothetical protein [Phytomonospora endophytica]
MLDDDFQPSAVWLAQIALWIQAAIGLVSTCVLAALWNGLARSGFPSGLIALILAAVLTISAVDLACFRRLGRRSRRARGTAVATQVVTMAATAVGVLPAQNAGSATLICGGLVVFALALTTVVALNRPAARTWLIW